MTRVLLAVGANLGDRARALGMSLSALAHLPDTQLLARSTWHETTPVGGPAGQASFLNGAVLLNTTLAPQELAHRLRQIEALLGRERHTRWDARRMDIDLLLFGDLMLETPELEIPHPRMAFRRFVLDPACEIAGEMVHADSGWTLAALRRHWQMSPRTVTIQAADPRMADWLAAELNGKLAVEDGDHLTAKTIEFVGQHDEPAMVIVLADATPTTGPVVRINSTDRAVILQEAAAAFQAAWPD